MLVLYDKYSRVKVCVLAGRCVGRGEVRGPDWWQGRTKMGITLFVHLPCNYLFFLTTGHSVFAVAKLTCGN